MVAQTTIQSPSSNYSVNFEGIIGNGYQGDIAIDDVSVVPGTCTLPGTVFQVLNVCENVKKKMIVADKVTPCLMQLKNE